MYKKETISNKGIVKPIVLIILGIAALSYFNVDLKSLFDGATFQNNVSYVWNFFWETWNNYIKGPFVFILNWILGKIS